MLKKKLILLFGFLIFVAFLSGATSIEDDFSRISGKVGSNLSAGGVSGVTITLFENGALKFSTRSDRNGNFSFVNIPPGQYSISAKKTGFNDFSKTIRLNPRFTLKIKFDLVSKEQAAAAPVAQPVKMDLPTNPRMELPKNNQSAKNDVPQPEIAKAEPGPDTASAQNSETAVIESEATTGDVPDYVANPDQLPEPEGGLAGIIRNIKYPELAIKRQIQGTVLVNVTVDQSGTAIQCDIKKSVDPILDEAAVETIYNSRFIPATHSGKKVSSTVAIPVKFIIR